MPEAKWDEGNESGKRLRYPDDNTPIGEIWQTTHEGTKLITFKTYKGHKRFYYGHCKIYKLKRRFFIREMLVGWNFWNGIPVLHNKFIFKKADSISLQDYAKYQEYIKFKR